MDPNLSNLNQKAIKALANPQRYELWQFFEGFQISVSDIAAEIEFSQPTVSTRQTPPRRPPGLLRNY